MLQLVKYYRNIENHLCEIEKAEAGCWISVINPTETEISDLEDDLGIDSAPPSMRKNRPESKLTTELR